MMGSCGIIMTKNTQYNDGRSCSICGNLKTTYHEWDCKGTWTSEVECLLGYDLEETDGTNCDDFRQLRGY